jgi:3-methyladenine DNA glycosylase Mpg
VERAWKAKDAEDRDAPAIARLLLGVVVRAAPGELARYRMMETEAYDGP